LRFIKVAASCWNVSAFGSAEGDMAVAMKTVASYFWDRTVWSEL
jgi:hypothetical protein